MHLTFLIIYTSDLPATISPIWYFALESEQSSFEPLFEDNDYEEGLPSRAEKGSDEDLLAGRFFGGTRPGGPLDAFRIRFKDSPDSINEPVSPHISRQEHEDEFAPARRNWHYFAARMAKELLWRGKGESLADHCRLQLC